MSLCIKATEVYICHYDYEGNYTCDLIGGKQPITKEDAEDSFDFSVYVDEVSTDTKVGGD